MCGRFVIDDDGNLIEIQFKLPEKPTVSAAYNIAPTQQVHVIGKKRDGSLGLSRFHWGLIPAWSKDKKIAAKLINARSETVAEKPSFREAYHKRRCLIPMSGFYEWQKSKSEKGKKRPMYIYPTAENEKLFAAAGLWESWIDPAGEKIYSCTILTTEPNRLMAPIHNRMPVFISPEHYERWLDLTTAPEEISHLFLPYPAKKMAVYEVSDRVNRVSNRDRACMLPI